MKLSHFHGQAPLLWLPDHSYFLKLTDHSWFLDCSLCTVTLSTHIFSVRSHPMLGGVNCWNEGTVEWERKRACGEWKGNLCSDDVDVALGLVDFEDDHCRCDHREDDHSSSTNSHLPHLIWYRPHLQDNYHTSQTFISFLWREREGGRVKEWESNGILGSRRTSIFITCQSGSLLASPTDSPWVIIATAAHVLSGSPTSEDPPSSPTFLLLVPVGQIC